MPSLKDFGTYFTCFGAGFFAVVGIIVVIDLMFCVVLYCVGMLLLQPPGLG